LILFKKIYIYQFIIIFNCRWAPSMSPPPIRISRNKMGSWL